MIRILEKNFRSIEKWIDRRLLVNQIRERGFPPVLWSKGYAAFASQNGGLKEVLGRTEKRWSRKRFLSLYTPDAESYWIPLTSNSKTGGVCPLDWFAETIIPVNQKPYVLITSDGDVAVPYELRSETVDAILSDQHLVFWYTQNLTDSLLDSRIKGIPIGLDLHSSSYAEIGWDAYDRIRDISETSGCERQDRPIIDFCLNKNSKDRENICDYFSRRNDCIVLNKPLPRHELWRLYANSKYVVSPEGVGPDCHRTWEALYLGAWVVCRNVGLGHLYEGLPVFQVDSWEELEEPGFFDRLEFTNLDAGLWHTPPSHMFALG